MTTARAYTIDLPEFAGPLDLLLHLIERQELDITALSLVNITGQYLSQIEQMKENRVEQLIDFIVVGARLAQIKSRALLPQIPVLPGEQEEEEDPAEALVRQLRLYKQFKEAGVWLRRREEQRLRTYLRVAPPPRLETRLDLSGVTANTLLTAVLELLSPAENLKESIAIIQPRRLTIEDQIKRLRYRVTTYGRFPFTDLLSPQTSGMEIAITLLAVLELIKRQEIQAQQNNLFGPIDILPAEMDRPATAAAAEPDKPPGTQWSPQ